jgi:7-carboxy-7-deazaguanine synthase
MFGKNLKLKPEYKNDNLLKVTNIFATFQGEGPYTGYPSIFIRLSGCNLACSFCDTEFDEYTELSVDEIINIGNKKFKEFCGAEVKTKPLIVITGGESMRQNISLLCRKFLEAGHIVQIESNGTLITPNIPNEVKIVCSPKISNGKYNRIREDILEKTIAIKFLVSDSNAEYSDIADVGQKNFNLPVYIQPMDEYDSEKNTKNLALAMRLATKYGGILSLQVHKMIGIE